MENQLVLFYIPIISKEAASQLVATLIEEKLIACANIIACDSIFMWEEELTFNPEYIIVAKSQMILSAKIEKRVSELHPYDTACILQIPAQSNGKFLSFVQSVTTVDEK